VLQCPAVPTVLYLRPYLVTGANFNPASLLHHDVGAAPVDLIRVARHSVSKIDFSKIPGRLDQDAFQAYRKPQMPQVPEVGLRRRRARGRRLQMAQVLLQVR
jgi:hypothetical protein